MRVRSRVMVGAAALAVVVGTVLGAGPARAGAAAPARLVLAHQTNDNLTSPGVLRASLGTGSVKGDLLVADVICGVEYGGMVIPPLGLPAGWKRGVSEIGGIKDGLEAAIYYYPRNPGGIEHFTVGRVTTGTVATCTVFTAEYAGVAGKVGVDASGRVSNLDSESLTVRTSRPTRQRGDLVLVATTDGVTIEANVYDWSKGYQLVGEQVDGHVNQPGVLLQHMAASQAAQQASVTWTGYPIDDVGVVLALTA